MRNVGVPVMCACIRNSLKNQNGDRISEAIGLGFYWLDRWFRFNI
jgi:hypothetical protein